MAADVYSLPPHIGRGGWTWYSGSAGWMYRLIVESLLGLDLEGNLLRITPCIPAEWKGFTVHYRYRETVYRIAVLRASGGAGRAPVSLDGVEQDEPSIPLVDDRVEHEVKLSMPDLES